MVAHSLSAYNYNDKWMETKFFSFVHLFPVSSTIITSPFVVLVLYFSIYFYLCSFNYSLFCVVYFFGFFCLWGVTGFVYFGFYNS